MSFFSISTSLIFFLSHIISHRHTLYIYLSHYYLFISCYSILVKSRQPTATEVDADIGSEKMEELNSLTSKFIMRSRLILYQLSLSVTYLRLLPIYHYPHFLRFQEPKTSSKVICPRRRNTFFSVQCLLYKLIYSKI